MKKIVTVVGARPQFIKAAVVSNALACAFDLHEVLIHTGQHFDANMSDVFFDELDIPRPAYNLGVGGGLHGAMTGMQLAKIEEVLISERPSCVLVYGDTNSTLAGALAAAKLHIPVAHVEAGLRSFNRNMPEEVNRVLTDHISSFLFCPTATSVENLLREGRPENSCYLVGDVMFDAALHFRERSRSVSSVLSDLSLREREFVLATIHRAENTDDLARLRVIVLAFSEVSKTIPVVWPVHPRTRKVISESGLCKELGKGVRLVDPVGYMDMIMLEQSASVIATDSGGVQKEAFFHKVPCVTLREETEWVELVQTGWNVLVPPIDVPSMVAAIYAQIGSEGLPVEPYGHGDAGKKIANCLMNNL